MAANFSFRGAGASHVGKVRALNEDSWIARPEIGLWAVADGMGGHGGGDVASQAVIKILGELPAPPSAAALLAEFETRIAAVNAELRALATSRSKAVIGATLVALLVQDRHFACVWCGDSRAYRLRAGALARISRDHSEVQDLIDRGVLGLEEAKTWPRRNVVTRALGVSDQVELEIVDGPASAGDRFLLCSDGLTAHVEDAEIAALLATEDARKICDDLIALTLERGASDNVTVMVVVCDDDTRTVRSDGEWQRRQVIARGGGP
jgi:serine/threonine protein phosphatase PrpC